MTWWYWEWLIVVKYCLNIQSSMVWPVIFQENILFNAAFFFTFTFTLLLPRVAFISLYLKSKRVFYFCKKNKNTDSPYLEECHLCFFTHFDDADTRSKVTVVPASSSNTSFHKNLSIHLHLWRGHGELDDHGGSFRPQRPCRSPGDLNSHLSSGRQCTL